MFLKKHVNTDVIILTNEQLKNKNPLLSPRIYTRNTIVTKSTLLPDEYNKYYYNLYIFYITSYIHKLLHNVLLLLSESLSMDNKIHCNYKYVHH